MNLTSINKSSTVSQKLSNEYDMIQLQNQQFINNALHEPAVRRCSKNLLVFSKEGVLKSDDAKVKVWLYAFRLYL